MKKEKPFTLYKEGPGSTGKPYLFATADGALNKARDEKWPNFAIYQGIRCITRVVDFRPLPQQIRPKPRGKKPPPRKKSQ